jgi:4-hydroxy-tetrahydrodipicolinate reductase
MSHRPRIVLTGATGKTGNAIAHGLAGRADVELVACVAPSLGAGMVPTRPVPEGVTTAPIIDGIDVEWDVLVDVTVAQVGIANVHAAIAAGKRAVLGTTGISDDELEELGAAAADAGVGLLYVPNFAIGAVLMMQFAEQAAKYFDDIEIVETHHTAKLDSPSGTARRTAQLIAAARSGSATTENVGTVEAGGDPARGEIVAGVPVHSLRLTGAVAHQTVTASGPGELLNIRHDAIDRACYAPGVARAAIGVRNLTGLHIGLEQVL